MKIAHDRCGTGIFDSGPAFSFSFRGLNDWGNWTMPVVSEEVVLVGTVSRSRN